MHAQAHAGGGEVARLPVEQDAALAARPRGRDRRPPRRARARRAARRRRALDAGARASRGTAAAPRRRRPRSVRRGRAAAGSAASALAISTRCCCPPDSSASRLRRSPASATDSRACVDGLAVGGAGPAPPTLLRQAPGGDDLLDRRRQVGRDARPLGHVADPPPVRRSAGDTPNSSTARLRRQQAEQDPQQGGLPGPVGSAEGRELPGAHMKPTSSSTRSVPKANETSSAASTTGAGSELSMILIMAGRRRRMRPGPARMTGNDRRHGPHDHGDALRRTAARNVGRLWIALGSPWSSWWSRPSPRSSPARWRCCPTPRTCSPTAWPSLSRSARSSSPTGRPGGVAHFRALPARDPGVAVNAMLLFAGRGATCSSKRCSGSPKATPGSSRAPCSSWRSSGSLVNVVVFAMLRAGAQDSLAVRGAYVDAMADAAGSVGVIVGGGGHRDRPGGIRSTPSCAADHRIWILPARGNSARARSACCCRSRPRTSTSTPIRRELMALPGVVDVHDLHVWTLTSEMDVASAHVMVGPRRRRRTVCSIRRGSCCSSTRSRTPPSRWSPTTTRGAPSSTGDAGAVGSRRAPGPGGGGSEPQPEGRRHGEPDAEAEREHHQEPGDRGRERARDLRVAQTW